MSSADCRIAPAKRSKKWRVDPGADAAAAERIAGRRADRDRHPVGPDQPGPVDQRAALPRRGLASDIRRSAGCRAGSAPGCRRSRARRARRSRGRSRAGSNRARSRARPGSRSPAPPSSRGWRARRRGCAPPAWRSPAGCGGGGRRGLAVRRPRPRRRGGRRDGDIEDQGRARWSTRGGGARRLWTGGAVGTGWAAAHRRCCGCGGGGGAGGGAGAGAADRAPAAGERSGGT